jgi:hypothetical protein
MNSFREIDIRRFVASRRKASKRLGAYACNEYKKNKPTPPNASNAVKNNGTVHKG